VQMVAEAGNATTAAEARRALALRVRATEIRLADIVRKVKAKRDLPFSVGGGRGLEGLDGDEIAELLEDGEI